MDPEAKKKVFRNQSLLVLFASVLALFLVGLFSCGDWLIRNFIRGKKKSSINNVNRSSRI